MSNGFVRKKYFLSKILYFYCRYFEGQFGVDNED